MICPVVSLQRGLAIALDGDRRGDAFARRLAAEDIDHPAEHAGELDAVFSSARTSARSE